MRQKISQNNVAELNGYPITDKEFEVIKTELLARTRTPFDAVRWLKGENGIAWITIEKEDIQLGMMSLVLYLKREEQRRGRESGSSLRYYFAYQWLTHCTN